MRLNRFVLTVVLTLTSPVALGDSILEQAKQAVKESTTNFNLRYRYEAVDQDGIEDKASASTLRGRMTWRSGNVGAWSSVIEADYVSLIGPEDYNSTANGKSNYPVVADPEGFDLNQAYIARKSDGVTATFGRQRILHMDQRFVGGVGWRQNEQTYDAFRAQVVPNKKFDIDYSYVWNVNRIFGPEDGAQPADWHGASHFLVSKYKLSDKHTFEGFFYLLDFDNDNGVVNSNRTIGLSYGGEFGPLKIKASYAKQSDAGDSPLDYDTDFYGIDAVLSVTPVRINFGHSVLGSDDGNVGFRTPLATLHKFQGWADKFLGTPATGIENSYVGVAGKIGSANVALTYHDFSADEGSADYGSEIDASISFKLTDAVTAQIKYAEYDADEFATDTRKVWASLTVAL